MPPERAHLSVAQYLESEAKSLRKREFVDGEIYAMSGASRRHNQITSNLHILAGVAAKDIRDCQVFGSDMKLHVESRNSFYYPDLMVSCDPSDDGSLYLLRPCFVVEVLSPSTASIDRREKRSSYETLPSLREYLIVDQSRMRAHLHFRRAGTWLTKLLTRPDDVVECSCLNLEMTLQQIYERVQLPPPGVAEEAPPEYGYDSEPIYE